MIDDEQMQVCLAIEKMGQYLTDYSDDIFAEIQKLPNAARRNNEIYFTLNIDRPNELKISLIRPIVYGGFVDVETALLEKTTQPSPKELWAIERARHILAGGDRVELIPQPGGDFKLVRVRHEPQRYEVKHD